MTVAAWCRRLTAQLLGWHVWRSGSGGIVGTSGWYAVPAPPDMTLAEARLLPGRLGPYLTPQLLRAACRQRYGWDEDCQSCGGLARECGHRSPETPGRR
jgi:hypothetical protein